MAPHEHHGGPGRVDRRVMGHRQARSTLAVDQHQRQPVADVRIVLWRRWPRPVVSAVTGIVTSFAAGLSRSDSRPARLDEVVADQHRVGSSDQSSLKETPYGRRHRRRYEAVSYTPPLYAWSV
jgi:hypothetical protein